MSEPVTRQRPAIDMDEFERHLDAPHLGHHDDDPLAELARLVGDPRDPYETVFAQEAVTHAPRGTRVPQEPQFDRSAPTPFPANFAAIEAGLRGSLPPHAEPVFDAQSYEHVGHDAYVTPEQGGGDYAFDPSYADGYGRATGAPRASRRPVYLMAATIAIGVVGVGAAFALKSHGTSPSDVRTIMAAQGPTKIQPPAQDTADGAGQDSALLGKGNQPQPTKLASNTEEPVDVSATVQNNAAQAAANGPTDAASVPVPPAPGQADAGSPPGASAPATDFALGMPAPKKVKVVSVRPDGTILSDATAPAASAPDAAAAPGAAVSEDAPLAAPVAKASTPKPATPKPVTTKSASRVTPKHAAPATIADAAADEAAAPKPAKKAKAEKLAMAEPTDGAPAADPAPKGAGSFAVQLAAPGSEAEARAASSKLAHKFAGALEGHRLGFHKAQSNGRTVFRVRADGLTKDAAQSLCDKLKADGGSCFVARS